MQPQVDGFICWCAALYCTAIIKEFATENESKESLNLLFEKSVRSFGGTQPQYFHILISAPPCSNWTSSMSSRIR